MSLLLSVAELIECRPSFELKPSQRGHAKSGVDSKITMVKMDGHARFFFGFQHLNENEMSDGGRDRALPGVEVWKSSQK
jgi:hypothetical protein